MELSEKFYLVGINRVELSVSVGPRSTTETVWASSRSDLFQCFACQVFL